MNDSGPPSRLPPVIFLMMVAGGLTAANVHYAPPLLPNMAAALHVQGDAISLLPALSQVGLALGLLVVLPLADLLERRQLLVCVLGFLAVAAAVQGLALNLAVLYTGGFMLGVGCVGAQLLTPYAALLAPPERQGEAVGLVLSGILCGAFLSKVVAGLGGAFLGWRAPFLLSAVLMVASAVVFARVLPLSNPEPRTTASIIIRSLGQLLKHANLRRHALNGALVSGAIMAFWSTYALHLSHTFGYGPAKAGLFGFVGIAGTLCAAFAGRRIDSGRFGSACLAAAVLLLAGFVCLWIGSANLVAFVLGVLLIDAGAGLGHSANQSAAFTLDHQARGRINSIYMTSYFLGGAAFTTIGVLAYARLGWSGVCGLGVFLGAAIGGMQLLAPISTRPGPPAPLVDTSNRPLGNHRRRPGVKLIT